MSMPLIAVAGLLAFLCAAGSQDSPALERTRLTEAIGLEPGRWTTTTVLESIELEPLPGRPPVPPEALVAARSRIGRPVESNDCVVLPTASESDFLLPGIRIGRGCRVEMLEASGGRLRYRAHCGDGGDYVAETSGEGTYARTSIEGRHRLNGASPGAGVAVRLTMRMTSRHEGQCRPGPESGPSR